MAKYKLYSSWQRNFDDTVIRGTTEGIFSLPMGMDDRR